jgi:hypothetical protein
MAVRSTVSNWLLVALAVASFCAGVVVLAMFDIKISTFLGILLASGGSMTPLAVISRRNRTDT